MFSPAALTQLASFAMLLALVNDKALAAPGTLTRRSRYNLSARQNGGGRQSGCGALKSQLQNVGDLAGQCVCFDTVAVTDPGNGGPTRPTPVFAQTTEALQYSINLPVFYPRDTNLNGQCNFPPGGSFTLLGVGMPANNCCNYRCDFGSCGEGASLVCLERGQQCQSGIPVASAGNSRRELRGRECPDGYTSCAVAFTGGRQFYECLDINTDLESCGGCMSPDPRSPFGQTALSGKFGQDCSAIPNAANVACVQGKCVVASCNKKYQLVNGECTDLE